jgi:hypothetical protein
MAGESVAPQMVDCGKIFGSQAPTAKLGDLAGAANQLDQFHMDKQGSMVGGNGLPRADANTAERAQFLRTQGSVRTAIHRTLPWWQAKLTPSRRTCCSIGNCSKEHTFRRETLGAIFRIAHNSVAPTGYIFRQGAKCDAVFFIRQGQVKIHASL